VRLESLFWIGFMAMVALLNRGLREA
jgi:hypothetical protein